MSEPRALRSAAPATDLAGANAARGHGVPFGEALRTWSRVARSVDQAAGIVWRYRDPENYYVVRANALEGNVVLYKVERGTRSDLDPIDSGLFAYGKQAPVRAGAWQELRVHVKGDLFQVHLDGAHLFDVRDATFAGAGSVGLWTKADSVTAFDDLAIEALDAHGEGS